MASFSFSGGSDFGVQFDSRVPVGAERGSAALG